MHDLFKEKTGNYCYYGDSVGFANGGQNEADGGEEVMFGHDFKSVYGVPVDEIVPKFQRRK